MLENTNEKGLVIVDRESVIYKIQRFIKRILHKKHNEVFTLRAKVNGPVIIPAEIDIKAAIMKEDTTNYYFMDCIRKMKRERAKVIEIQEQYANGEIKEKLSEEQIDSLCDLYNKQIESLQKLKELSS